MTRSVLTIGGGRYYSVVPPAVSTYLMTNRTLHCFTCREDKDIFDFNYDNSRKTCNQCLEEIKDKKNDSITYRS